MYGDQCEEFVCGSVLNGLCGYKRKCFLVNIHLQLELIHICFHHEG